MDKQRRKFLIFLAALVVGGKIAYDQFSKNNVLPVDHSLEQLLQLYGSPEDAIQVGRKYLRDYPDTSYSSFLDELMSNDTIQDRENMSISELLINRIRTDFKSNRTVLLNNWVLSETEVKVYSIFARSL